MTSPKFISDLKKKKLLLFFKNFKLIINKEKITEATEVYAFKNENKNI